MIALLAVAALIGAGALILSLCILADVHQSFNEHTKEDR